MQSYLVSAEAEAYFPRYYKLELIDKYYNLYYYNFTNTFVNPNFHFTVISKYIINPNTLLWYFKVDQFRIVGNSKSQIKDTLRILDNN